MFTTHFTSFRQTNWFLVLKKICYLTYKTLTEMYLCCCMFFCHSHLNLVKFLSLSTFGFSEILAFWNYWNKNHCLSKLQCSQLKKTEITVLFVIRLAFRLRRNRWTLTLMSISKQPDPCDFSSSMSQNNIELVQWCPEITCLHFLYNTFHRKK